MHKACPCTRQPCAVGWCSRASPPQRTVAMPYPLWKLARAGEDAQTPARKWWGGEKVKMSREPPPVRWGHCNKCFCARAYFPKVRYPQVTPRQHQKHQKDSTFGESKPRGSAVITRVTGSPAGPVSIQD